MRVVHSPLGLRWTEVWQKILRLKAAEAGTFLFTSSEYLEAHEEFRLLDEEIIDAPFETPSEALTKLDAALHCAWTTVAADEMELEGWPLVQSGRDLLVNGNLPGAAALLRQAHFQAWKYLGQECLHIAWRQVNEAVIALDRSFTGATRAVSRGASAAVPGARSNPRQVTRLDYTVSDAPLLDEMKSIIEGGEATNAWDAALAVCGRAAGKGTPASKAKRLHKRFKLSVQHWT